MKVRRLQGERWLHLRADEVPEGGYDLEVGLSDEWLRPRLTSQYATVGADVEVDVHATRGAVEVEAHGALRTRVGFVCSRCGEDVERPVDVTWHVLCAPASASSVSLTDDSAPRALDDLVMAELVDGVADLETPIAEAMVLALPAYPLCKDDCAGVCAGCGANLNVETCRCTPTPRDGRWAALADLKQRLEK